MQSSILINLCYLVWTHFNSAMTKLSHREWQISDMTSTTLRLWNTQTIYTRSTNCRSGKISENHPIRWVCAIYSSHTALHVLRCLSGFENTSYKHHAMPCHAHAILWGLRMMFFRINTTIAIDNECSSAYIHWFFDRIAQPRKIAAHRAE